MTTDSTGLSWPCQTELTRPSEATGLAGLDSFAGQVAGHKEGLRQPSGHEQN